MSFLQRKRVFITGASRGIGKAIGLRLAQDGARIAIAAKTAEPHPKLPGTIHTAAAEIQAAGGEALPLQVDIRSEEQVQAALGETVRAFGGLDILINNASAINLSGTLDLPMKRYDLMQDVNTRGTFLCSKLALPHLLAGSNPHILNLSPPLNLDPRWFAAHTAYTIAKYGMSMCVLGLAAEFEGRVAVNALWPRTAIATAAIRNLLGGEDMLRQSRKPAIVADAAHAILSRPASEANGRFFLDEDVLREAGVTDFDAYAVEPGNPLVPDFFLNG